MQVIEHIELTSSQASITFSDIPQTGYTDLYLVYSVRLTRDGDDAQVNFNGSTTGYSQRELFGTGSSVSTASRSDSKIRQTFNPSTTTASTFSSAAIYIPNYTSSNYKSFSVDGAYENNATAAYQTIKAGLWSNTAAITSITITDTSNLAQYSSATLFGITAGSDGVTSVS
jgi:hypothetical protein